MRKAYLKLLNRVDEVSELVCELIVIFFCLAEAVMVIPFECLR
jgi:hypothetical protein